MNQSTQRSIHSSMNLAMDGNKVELDPLPQVTTAQTETAQQTGASQSTRGAVAPASGRIWLERRFSVNQLTTLPWSLPEDLETYQQHGVAAIGLNARKLREYGVRRAMRRVMDSQMLISSLGCIGGFTGENGQTIKETMAECRRLIRVAGQLRAGTVTVITGPQGCHIRSNANRLVIDSLKQLVPMAALYGVQLALQPMHPMFARSWTFLHSLHETMSILDRVQDSRLKIAFNSYHLWQEPELLKQLGTLASRIGLVRLGDWGDAPRNDHDRLLPGQGRLPLSRMIQTLDAHGYSGWYELEVWSRDLWKMDRRDLMQACISARDQLAATLTAF